MTKMVEISEEQFLNDKKLRETVAAILDNPDARPLVLEAQKKAFPNARIPELDAQKPILEAVNKIREETSNFIKEQREREEKRVADDRVAQLNKRFEAGRSDLKAAGYTEEGIKAVEKLMEDKGILDHSDAVAIFEKNNPRATPVVSDGMGRHNFFDMPKDGGTDEVMKRMIESKGEDAQALSSLVNGALAEVRGTNRR